MKNSLKIIFLFAFIVAAIASGCYTQLMTPREFVQTQRWQSKQVIADNSYSINYNQSCVTCHSVAELDERAEELEYYGIRTVHDGIFLSAHLWRNEQLLPNEILIGNPGPVYWPRPPFPTDTWWTPPATAVTTSTPSTNTNGNGDRIRTGGSTRDGNRERERNEPIPSPTYTQPQTPVGGTTSTPSIQPATSVAPQQPSTPSAQTNDSRRSRDSSDNNNSSSRTRTDGSSRDNDGDRPR